MDGRLQGRQWLAADRFTIADCACFPWVLLHDAWGERLPIPLLLPQNTQAADPHMCSALQIM